jgi:putative tributyrin esterase
MKRFFLTLLLLSFFVQLHAQETLILNPIYVPSADTTWIFTPKDYQTSGKKYPVMFLLHGWSGNYKQWNGIINCQKYADAYGFVLVCPDGFYDSWYVNSPKKPLSQFVDFFYKDLFPKIKQKYEKIDDKNVFITGLSMGGYGAMHIFLQKPEFFKAVGCTSGLMDLRTEATNYGIAKILGTPDVDYNNWYKLSMINNVSKLAASGKEIIFDCGTEDKFYEGNNIFHKKCDEEKVKATYITMPGKHDKNYWKKSIKFHFDFFKGLAVGKD